MTGSAPQVRVGRLIWVVGFVAAALIGFEISLMRMLLVASYHHFAFLVITVVLLGFGASGSALYLARRRLVPHGENAVLGLAVLTGVLIPVCSTVAQRIPIDAVVLPATLWRQIGCWILYWAVLTTPFFFGAAVLGFALMIAKGVVARVYASNLIGSAAGAALVPLAMIAVPPAWLPLVMGGVALVGAVGAGKVSITRRLGLLVAAGIAIAAGTWIDPPNIRIDQFKDMAHLERLRAQGSAERVAEIYGPRGVITAYQSDVLHDLPFLTVGATPPPVTAVVIDGHRAGSVLKITDVEQADAVENTLMAFPYVLAPPRPRVLLLGEIGGSNVWLALRKGAATIDVVQPRDTIYELLRGPLRNLGGIVFDRPGVRTTTAEPRHFVEHTADRFDLIQLTTLESLPAGSAGLGGLAEDHLITVEGITACLRRLAPDGMLAASRGIQTPPRDNVKLLTTMVEALGRMGITSPGRHIVIVRDYLAVCTIVSLRPWSPGDVERIRRACAERQLTPVWFEGVEIAELNQPDRLPAGPDGAGDWYHYAARQIFSPRCKQFVDDWFFDIRPPTDNRPFFHDYGRLRSIGELRRAFGDIWMTRAELGFVFVAAAAAFVAVIGAALTLLPLAMARSAYTGRGRMATLGYFAAIGLAYLAVEMTYLSRLTHLIGDPVLAAAVTIAGFLALSGLGSLTAQRVKRRRVRTFRWVIVGVVVVGSVEMFLLPPVASAAGAWPIVPRCLLSLVAVAPIAYLMGFPMPLALQRLEHTASALIPWAWGVNGFASVLAAPLATLIGMTWGFHVAGVVALLLYATTMGLFAKLPMETPGYPTLGLPR